MSSGKTRSSTRCVNGISDGAALSIDVTMKSRKRSATSRRLPGFSSSVCSIVHPDENRNGYNADRGRRTSARNCVSAQRLERSAAGIGRLRAEFLLDAKQLIVFCRAIGARHRAGFDLAAIGCDGEIGDGRILGLARAMRHDCRVAGLMRGFDGGERLGQRADLIDLNQDRVTDAVFYAV